VISALRARRLDIAAQLHDTEKKVSKLRAALANLDAAMILLTPDHPDGIPKRRDYRRTKYFDRKELPRLALDALREAKGPVSLGATLPCTRYAPRVFLRARRKPLWGCCFRSCVTS